MNDLASCRPLPGKASSAPLVTSSASSNPPSIEELWQDRRATFLAFERAPTMHDRGSSEYWDRQDAIEVAILNNPERSIRAAEIRLWLAWSHYDGMDRTAVWLGDVPALLAIRDDLDWQEKLIFAAILNLRGEG